MRMVMSGSTTRITGTFGSWMSASRSSTPAPSENTALSFL
jgi:hypothetical protein